MCASVCVCMCVERPCMTTLSDRCLHLPMSCLAKSGHDSLEAAFFSLLVGCRVEADNFTRIVSQKPSVC